MSKFTENKRQKLDISSEIGTTGNDITGITHGIAPSKKNTRRIDDDEEELYSSDPETPVQVDIEVDHATSPQLSRKRPRRLHQSPRPLCDSDSAVTALLREAGVESRYFKKFEKITDPTLLERVSVTEISDMTSAPLV